MDKTKEEFVYFVRNAVTDKNCDAYIELYQFLLGCFVRADKNLTGKVALADFDALIEEAAALPRRYGFAPKSSDMYANDAARQAARATLFAGINASRDGAITFAEWISYAEKHIFSKVATLKKDPLTSPNVSKADFIAFIKKAVNKSNPEYKELYHFLLKCFTDADRDRDGAVNPKEFDAMIEEAAGAPRRFGLAPLSSAMYKTEAARLAARTQEFRTMDVNNDGTIAFSEWLNYAVTHIVGKVAKV